MKISEALANTINTFKNANIESYGLDARVLLAHILNIEQYRLILDNQKDLSEKDIIKLNDFTKRRVKGEPIAYITGKKEFYSIELDITKDVLIPRPETEQLVDLAIFYARKHSTVLDIGTGSGAIAIALKKNRPDLIVYACDISYKALEIAKKNAGSILGDNSIYFFKSDLFHAFKGKKFNLILSNPPYLDIASIGSLQKEILFEPKNALFADAHGNETIRRIICRADEFLSNNGFLIIEIGDQYNFIQEICAQNNYSVSILKDYANLPRIAVLQKNK
ncbi:MAG: peptide chain release factor N(5)-glutamine methyltransferase [Spirochaetes bacterium]|nr:peptide chain release factor N(5)-glutamine methyltransferase [Spirochaetota bacterium]